MTVAVPTVDLEIGARTALGATQDAFPVISVFSGAGGMDLGIADVGGSVRVCVEADNHCVDTLHLNRAFFPEAAVIDRPIEYVRSTEILGEARLEKGEAALLIGGPPCQPFSKSGYWLQERREGANDGRAFYLAEYLRVVRDTRPEAFILENVPSLLHASHREGLEWFAWRARRLGYSVDYRVLHAPEYGVPQGRTRLFVLGLRGKHAPKFPTPTHWWHSRDETTKLKRPETAGRWLAPLDKPELAEAEEVASGRWESALREVPPGENYKYLTAWGGHPNPLFVTETKYWSFLLKLSPYRPSWTIQASPGPWTGPFHWDSRRLRVPELAALQTFPRQYQFSGGRRARMRQIGNAVPCQLAAAVAAALLEPVLGFEPARRQVLRYRLATGFDFDESLISHRGHRW
jgi:DNA (cytosine-5)-methyltransferase 1